MGMGGMGMGGMGMSMGMGGMGMMGGGMMGGGGGGGGGKRAPAIETPPDLTRAEYIQLGTDLVSREEVKGQPQAETRTYLQRQLGLTQSETAEVMRRAGFGEPPAGESDPRGGRELAAVARQHADTQESSPSDTDNSGSGERPPMDALRLLFEGSQGLLSAPLAAAAAAAAAAPEIPTWRSFMLGPSAEEAQQRTFRLYEQTVLQQAAAVASPVMAAVPQSAAVGTIVLPTQRHGMLGAAGRTLFRSSVGKGLLLTAFCVWLLRSELKPLLTRMFHAVLAKCGLQVVDRAAQKQRREARASRRHRRRRRQIAEGAPLTEEEEEQALQLEKGTLKQQLAALRQQLATNDATLAATRVVDDSGSHSDSDEGAAAEAAEAAGGGGGEVRTKEENGAAPPRPPPSSSSESSDAADLHADDAPAELPGGSTAETAAVPAPEPGQNQTATPTGPMETLPPLPSSTKHANKAAKPKEKSQAKGGDAHGSTGEEEVNEKKKKSKSKSKSKKKKKKKSKEIAPQTNAKKE